MKCKVNQVEYVDEKHLACSGLWFHSLQHAMKEEKNRGAADADTMQEERERNNADDTWVNNN